MGNRYCSEEHRKLDAEQMKNLGLQRLQEAVVRQYEEIDRWEPAGKPPR
jgi:hypothetical protein